MSFSVSLRGFLIICVRLCILLSLGNSWTHAQSIFDRIREQNTTPYSILTSYRTYIAGGVISPPVRPICYTTDQVRLTIPMYHYIRPDHRDQAESITAYNSISPGVFEQHMQYLATQQQEKNLHTALFSELESRQTSNCFPHKHIVLLTADDGRWDNYAYIFPIVKKLPIKFNLGIIYNRIGHTERIDPFMHLGELQEIQAHPRIELQSHSVSHADLRELGYASQYEEICTSKLLLEELLDTKMNTFIYPVGGYNTTSTALAKQCGYTYALTTQSGIVSGQELTTTPHTLQRIRVDKETRIEEIIE